MVSKRGTGICRHFVKSVKRCSERVSGSGALWAVEPHPYNCVTNSYQRRTHAARLLWKNMDLDRSGLDHPVR